MKPQRPLRLKRQRGQSVVELALVVPVFILLVMGMVDFGLAFNQYLTLQHAVREGARLAITGATDSAIIQRVIDRSQGLDRTKLTLTVSPGQSSRLSGTNVKVEATYNFTLLTPVVSQVVGSNLRLKTGFTTRVE